MQIAVSFLSSINDPKTTLNKIAQTSCDYLHVDIMDGLYVSNKTMDLEELLPLLKNYPKHFDIHLMVENPYEYIKKLIPLKPKYITFHAKTAKNVSVLVNLLHHNNIKAGLALNPNEEVSSIKKYLKSIDLVLVMCVYPGSGGQKFMPEVIPKIQELKKIQSNYLISCDGGINEETAKLINPDILVSGSFICHSDNYEEQLLKLKS